MKGGMAMSTEFEVSFEFPDIGNPSLKSVVKGALGGIHTLATDDIITMFCNEAQLPNVSSLTGQTNGIFMGEGQVNYSYGKLFTCLLYTSPSPRDLSTSRMPSSA